MEGGAYQPSPAEVPWTRLQGVRFQAWFGGFRAWGFGPTVVGIGAGFFEDCLGCPIIPKVSKRLFALDLYP